MSPVGFEPTISAGERSQTYDLDCAVDGTGHKDHFFAVALQHNAGHGFLTFEVF